MKNADLRLAVLERRIEELTRQVGGMAVRRGRTTRGKVTSSSSKFAIVTSTAGKSTYSSNGINGGTIGKCSLLNEDMQRESFDADKDIEFKSLHFVRVPLQSLILLFASSPITPGSKWPSAKVWGKYIASPQELYELEGANEKKVLYLPTGANEAQDMVWRGKECPPPPQP